MDFEQDSSVQTLEEIIHSRRSIRRYQQRAIDKSTLDRLLDAAIWAPSAHNRQPWRFCVITGEEAKDRLSNAMSEQWHRDLSQDGADPEFIARRVAISRVRMTNAAALILVALSMEEMDRYPDEVRSPKSSSLAPPPSPGSMTLPGLRSRWSTPRR